MTKKIFLTNGSTGLWLDMPSVPTDQVVLFLPGISGGALSDRFLSLVQACLDHNLAIARLSPWESAEELRAKTIADLQKEINETILLLKQKGFTKIIGVGKSFGGKLLLTYSQPSFVARVLWAPAIDPTEIVPEKMIGPIGILHGTADERIPLKNSEQIVARLPNAKLIPIEGADHSYKNKLHEQEVIKQTLNFISSEVRP